MEVNGMSIEAMKQALEALEELHRTGDTQVFDLCYAPKVIPALRTAIEQAEKQEPVAYTTGHCKEKAQPGGCQLHNLHCGYPDCDRKAVATPPAAPVQPVAWAVVGEGEWGKWDIGNQFETGNPPNHKYWSDRGYELAPLYTTPPAAPVQPVAMRMPKVGDKVVCIEDESLGTVVYLTAGGSPEIKFDDGSHGTYMLREFAELFGYTAPPNVTTPPAAQRQWVELTNEEIDKTYETQVWDARRSYARAIEAKLKEKNT
jgi:hypothetical protein